jgi:hypothetical protein
LDWLIETYMCTSNIRHFHGCSKDLNIWQTVSGCQASLSAPFLQMWLQWHAISLYLLFLTQNGSFFLTLVQISSPSTLHSCGASICYTLHVVRARRPAHYICGHITSTSATFLML